MRNSGIDITEEYKYGQSHSMNLVQTEIVQAQTRIESLQIQFQNAPSSKTAKPLAAMRVKKTFLETALKYTVEYRLIQEEKTLETINSILDIVAPEYKAVKK